MEWMDLTSKFFDSHYLTLGCLDLRFRCEFIFGRLVWVKLPVDFYLKKAGKTLMQDWLKISPLWLNITLLGLRVL